MDGGRNIGLYLHYSKFSCRWLKCVFSKSFLPFLCLQKIHYATLLLSNSAETIGQTASMSALNDIKGLCLLADWGSCDQTENVCDLSCLTHLASILRVGTINNLHWSSHTQTKVVSKCNSVFVLVIICIAQNSNTAGTHTTFNTVNWKGINISTKPHNHSESRHISQWNLLFYNYIWISHLEKKRWKL